MLGARVLILVPHPDDEVVGAAAAIRRAQAAGAEVFAAYLTEGVPRHLWPWEIRRARVARRWREAESAAERLGITRVLAQPIPSRELRLHLAPTLARLEALVASTGADVVWAPAYEGGHQDHDAASYLASRLAAGGREVWEFAEYNFAGGALRRQRFPAPRAGEVALSLDAREQRAKEELLELYRSERANLGHVGVDRETFRPLEPYDYARPPHDGPLFYARFRWVPWHPRIDHTPPAEVSRCRGR